MTDNRDINIRIASSKLTHPEFLQGLDIWLQLGLITEWQVLEICQDRLSCDLPPWPAPIEEVLQLEPIDLIEPFVILPPQPRPKPRLQELQTFISEVSVIWLLFLGVFLVVVSSGVFAASQWQNLPSIGQYGILLTYTLAFTGASWWSSRQPNLRLTAQMLQFATLLIVPVNFWMMDSLRLWSNAPGIGMSIVAAGLLSIASLTIIKPLTTPITLPLTLANSLILSWLHWGWNVPLVPLIATYIGTLSTTFALFWRYRQQQRTAAEQPTQPARWLPISLAIGVLILIVRAIWIHQVPVAQLGLAFGSCGWLLCWLNRENSTRIVWLPGILLLLLGWGVSVQQIPAQALGVSLLGCSLLWDRLRTHRRAGDLLALWLLGLQTYGLTGWIAPPEAKGFVTQFLMQVFGDVGMPGAMWSLGGLWYVLITLILADWLWRGGETKLDRQALFLAGLLAGCLTLVSTANPGIRSLNLSFSAIILLLLAWRRRPAGITLIYLFQAIAIAAIASWINVVHPQLSLTTWGWIVMTGALLEWLGTLGRGYHSWRQSAWHVGLGLASLSYLLLIEQPPGQLWWISIPVALTVMSRQRFFCGDGTIAASLSSIALVFQLFLLYPYLSPSMMMALGASTGVMLINTATLHSLAAAGLTIGLALGTELLAIDRYLPQVLVVDNLVGLAAVQVWLLWWGRDWLQQKNNALRELYVRSINAWAIAIAAVTLLFLFYLSIDRYQLAAPPSFVIVAGAGLLTLTIVYRLWQKPQEIGWYGLASSLGCFAVLLVELLGGRWPSIAVTLLALGLASQLAGDLWVRRSGHNYRPSWYLIPLAYGLLGLAIGHNYFTANAGFYSLTTAIIGVGVGRRSRVVKPIVVISIAMISVGLYELLIFQLLQLSGGKTGDGVVALAGLAGLLAFGYRLLGRWLQRYFQFTPLEMQLVSHLHWLLGTFLGLTAPSLGLSNVRAWLVVMGGLSIYALAVGNRRLQSADSNMLEIWTYLGILQALGTAGYGVYQLVPDPTLIELWGGSVSAAIAWRIYKIDWLGWGWPPRPWQQISTVLPLAIVLLTAQSIDKIGLVIVAAFYGWLALARHQWRISYLSIGLLDWALSKSLIEQQQLTLLWISALIGVTLLYVVQVEPLLQEMSARDRRHWLRSIAAGQLVVNIFYQAEINRELIWAIMPLVLGLGLVILGLRFQIRAFLYIGTLAFILRVGRSIWLFTDTYPLTLWGVGLVLGLVMIWVAATFEARRSQINALMQHWIAELEQWD